MLYKLISSLSQMGKDGKPEFYTHIINSLWKLGTMPLVSNLEQLGNDTFFMKHSSRKWVGQKAYQ